MKKSKKKLIWIDVDNSPHVLFFQPFVEQFRKKDVQIIITARRYAQVIELLRLLNLEYIPVGRHYGGKLPLKIFGTLLRAIQLLFIMLNKKPDLAISHGSRSQLIAAKILKIKAAVAFDYEHTKGNWGMRPDIVICPEIIPEVVTTSYSNVYRYKGIKEDIYVPNFKPNLRAKKELGIENGKIVVTVRPPASLAHYHTQQGEIRFTELLNFLARVNETYIVIVPRTREQAEKIKTEWKGEFKTGKFYIPTQVIYGLDIIWNSDLVMSGGGTMIREAAALNIPAYSVFGGEIGAVDKYLENNNRLIILRSKKDIEKKISIQQKKVKDIPFNSDNTLLIQIVDWILNCV